MLHVTLFQNTSQTRSLNIILHVDHSDIALQIVMKGLTRRKVKTGNPTHGNSYRGYIHTCSDVDPKDHINGCNIVAICNVPPTQVPEGVLNFARGYKSQILHVRVLIEDDEDSSSFAEEDDVKISSKPTTPIRSVNSSSNNLTDRKLAERIKSNGSSFLRDAAAILSEEDDMSDSDHECGSSSYMVLFSLNSIKAANSFVESLNGKAFNSFEKDITASIYHVAKIESDSNHGGHSDDPLACMINPSLDSKMPIGIKRSSPSRTRSLSFQSMPNEIPNCPVCLEQLNVGVSSAHSSKRSSLDSSPSKPSSSDNAFEDEAIFTTVCNHTFHMQCLLQWKSNGCPVCRYDHAGLNDSLTKCHVCGSTENIYLCLICGIASCAGLDLSNDVELPSSSSHSCQQGASVEDKYAYGEMIAQRNSIMEINSGSHECRPGSSKDTLDFNANSHGHAKQHYDETLHAYAVDTSTQHVWDFAGQGYVHRLIQNTDGKIVEISDPTNTTSGERSLLPSLTDNEEGEIIHRKLERFAGEYNSLLKDQLEQQRLYFESILMQIKRDHDLAPKIQSASTLISALKQDLHQLQQRYKTIQQKSAKVSENIAFLKNMNESLESNKEPMQKEIRSLQEGRTEYSRILHDNLSVLEEKIQKLMLKLE